MNHISIPTTCPECGAAWSEADQCQSTFDEFLALEFTDPGYGDVHFLTVACFMIQHNRYSDEGLGWIRTQLRRYLEENLNGPQIRKIAAESAGLGQRTWKVTRAPDAPALPKITWRVTIIDVIDSIAAPEEYRAAVLEWARATYQQMPAYP